MDRLFRNLFPIILAGTFFALTASGQFINNSQSLQPNASYNIDGRGTATAFRSAKGYEIGKELILSVRSSNLFIGIASGKNTIGDVNTFVGNYSGWSNTSGHANSFFGTDSGAKNTSGGRNSFFGQAAGFETVSGVQNAFFGTDSGHQNTEGRDNAFFGERSGMTNKTGEYNTFIGGSTGFSNASGSHISLLGHGADASKGLNFATAIGSGAKVTNSNTIQLGRFNLDFVRIGKAGLGGALPICLNSANVLSACSSSARYKSNIADFKSGLAVINKLRPVSFSWKDTNLLDFGLVAEDVGAIEPLLVSTDSSGKIEGVKYSRVSVVLINAVKEQQVQINELNRSIEMLKRLVCSKREFRNRCK